MYRSDLPSRCRERARSPVRQPAATLIELLVVMSMIGLLISILIPSLKQSMELAAATVCKHNLREIGAMPGALPHRERWLASHGRSIHSWDRVCRQTPPVVCQATSHVSFRSDDPDLPGRPLPESYDSGGRSNEQRVYRRVYELRNEPFRGQCGRRIHCEYRPPPAVAPP